MPMSNIPGEQVRTVRWLISQEAHLRPKWRWQKAHENVRSPLSVGSREVSYIPQSLPDTYDSFHADEGGCC